MNQDVQFSFEENVALYTKASSNRNTKNKKYYNVRLFVINERDNDFFVIKNEWERWQWMISSNSLWTVLKEVFWERDLPQTFN